jgi:hypothetical protein
MRGKWGKWKRKEECEKRGELADETYLAGADEMEPDVVRLRS